jgi:rare lipoprotein A (peptidoglycan hydrolase)
LVTSACAIDKTPEESTSHSPDDPSVSPGGLLSGGGSADYGYEQAERRLAGFTPAANACGGIPNACCSPWRTTGITLFGKAAWYNLVGRQTASGETLDTATATAAHRSLPLASYAKVTNLANGHSVVVKINDRGPYTRGRILDLSPRAADTLDMKRVGVAAVVVEPLANQAGPTVAVLQPSGTEVSQ